MTGKINEVRPVLNDPVNAKLGSDMPTFTHSHNSPDRFWCGSKITDLVGVQALVLLVLNFCTTTISVNISTVNNLTFFLMIVAYV